jgi:hypothetical protein
MKTEMPMHDKPSPSSADFNFPKGAKYQPKGFGNLKINDSVTITVKGKVKSLSIREGQDYGGKDFRLDIESCVIGNDDGDKVNYESE